MKQYEHGGNVWVKENPHQWLDFSANINPYGPPAIINEVLNQSVKHVNAYPEPYAETARQELAKYLKINYEQTLVTSGGISAMELVMRVLSPSHSLIIQPGFVEYERLSKLYSNSFENYSVFMENGTYQLDFDVLEDKLKRADVIFLCHPSNPLGQTFSKNQIIKLINLCMKNQVIAIIDEAFIHYCPDKTLINEINNNNIIIVGSLTKIYSIPGVRIGYIATNRQILKKLEQKYLPWSVNIFAQSIVKVLNTTVLKDFELESVSKNNSAKTALLEQLNSLGFKAYNSLTNYLLLNTSSLNLTGSQINKGLAKHKIMVRECSNFIGLNNHFIRVAIKKPEQNQYLIDCLKEVIKCGTY